jgi:hypothetical protein
MVLLWVSIDPGISLLGMSCGVCNTDYTGFRVTFIESINLTIMCNTHTTISRKECQLYHTNELSDRIDHFIQEYIIPFEACDMLFIERQPINGHTDVEQLLFKAFRSKAELVPPRSMHVTFGINGMKHLPKDDRRLWRKQQTTKLCVKYMQDDVKEKFQNMIDAFNRDPLRNPPPYDPADSICLSKHMILQKRTENRTILNPLIARFKRKCEDSDDRPAKKQRHNEFSLGNNKDT